jgi:arabinose-5-phosphate isomerase
MLIKELCFLHLENIKSSFSSLEEQKLLELANLINSCSGIVYFTGVGKNGHVAAKAASTFASIGVKSIYINPVDAVHGDMGNICENDIVINISKSGNTEELLNFLHNLRNNNKIIKIVSIHSNDDGQTARLANINVYIPAIKEIDNYNIVPTTSIAAYVIFLQSLGVYISNLRDFSLSKFKKNHPGGSIGIRLKNE